MAVGRLFIRENFQKESKETVTLELFRMQHFYIVEQCAIVTRSVDLNATCTSRRCILDCICVRIVFVFSC